MPSFSGIQEMVKSLRADKKTSEERFENVQEDFSTKVFLLITSNNVFFANVAGASLELVLLKNVLTISAVNFIKESNADIKLGAGVVT